jgi:hypothetical protein
MGLDAANEAMPGGRIDELNKSLMERTQPEAAYFCTENGRRTSYVFFDLADPSEIPVIAEPLFRHLGANVQFIPAMNRRGPAEGPQRGRRPLRRRGATPDTRSGPRGDLSRRTTPIARSLS